VVMLKMNFFTPTKKPVGYSQAANGQRKRVYDTPQTPYQRLLNAGTMSLQQQQELRRVYEKINPAELARDITRYQGMLITKAKAKTEYLTAEVEDAKSGGRNDKQEESESKPLNRP